MSLPAASWDQVLLGWLFLWVHCVGLCALHSDTAATVAATLRAPSLHWCHHWVTALQPCCWIWCRHSLYGTAMQLVRVAWLPCSTVLWAIPNGDAVVASLRVLDDVFVESTTLAWVAAKQRWLYWWTAHPWLQM